MHFSKTYTQLLLTLPPELSQSAIQYRELKKIINKIVAELTSLGLSPDVLHSVIQPSSTANDKGKQKEGSQHSGPRVVYELVNAADHVVPRLRFYLDNPNPEPSDPPSHDQPPQPIDISLSAPLPQNVLQLALLSSESHHNGEFLAQSLAGSSSGAGAGSSTGPHELIVPLASDATFFQTLSEALESLSRHLTTRQADFQTTLKSLSHDISSTARPSSSMSSFRPYSRFSSNPASISVPSGALALTSKSDLETWREIFQIYIEADIFQGHQERFRGERAIEDSEARLVTFSSNVQERISSGALKLRLKQSRVALQTFMELNTFILNVRKFQSVTAEATRKILKKHAKRTALPLAPELASPFTIRINSRDHAYVLARTSSRHTESLSLSLLLVQALTETLLPIVPHIDDYSCVICLSLAFKPIRLHCGHLFCVRCLVKLQKRGERHCPMCRAPTVLSADRSNVDWALLNFMKDWFPAEARQKLQQNEREVAEEQMQELGLDVRGCIIS